VIFIACKGGEKTPTAWVSDTNSLPALCVCIAVAFVVKKPGSILDKHTLIEHCKEHLTHYKIPRKIEWIESLPKSNVGKILKRKLTQ